MSDIREANGHPLRVIRAQHDLTLAELSEAINVSVATLSRIENGLQQAGPDTRRRLVKYFNKTSQELGLIALGKKAASIGLEALETKTEVSVSTTFTTEVPTIVVSHHNPINISTEKIPEQQLGEWLARQANEIAQLFDAGWKTEAIINALSIVLQGAQGIPTNARRTLLQIDSSQLARDTLLTIDKHTSEEERSKLCVTLGKSCEDSWNLFQKISNEQLLIIAQAQLSLLNQIHSLLYDASRPLLYSSTYRLLGAAYFFQARYTEALQAHRQAYLSALEAGDAWNMAESLGWQSGVWKACGEHQKSIELTEAALRLLTDLQDQFIGITKARLLAQWAESAALLQRPDIVEEKLAASATLLGQSEPNQEFTPALWHYYKGTCAFYLNNSSKANDYFQQALKEYDLSWTNYRASTLLFQAETMLEIGERDQSIALARSALPLIVALDAPLISWGTVDYVQALHTRFPHHLVVTDFVSEVQQQLILSSKRTVPRYLAAKI